MSKRYRNIYNMDSSAIMLNAVDRGDYVEGTVKFLEDNSVDALFWMDGAGGNTANYDSDVLELTGYSSGNISPLLQRLIRDGDDPPKIIVREVRRMGIDIFYSCRLNDCHDSLGHDFLIPGFKRSHPEWTIGPDTVYGGGLNLDFSHPEVRDLKFSVIEEIFRKYDFDGLEIDFLRSPPYFQPGSEPSNSHFLTDFVRRVRRHLHSRGTERGRAVTLAVRVDETLEACRLDGFDVPAWVQEGLVDIIVVGSGSIDVHVEEFVDLVRGSEIGVYPCLYGWPSGYMPISTEMARALAVNYLYQGGDGIYTFNWNAHSNAHRPEENAHYAYQRPLLREFMDPSLLTGTNKRFPADRGRPTRVYPHYHMGCVLPASLEAGDWIDVPIMVGENFSKGPEPKSIDLVVDCEGPTIFPPDYTRSVGDLLGIKLNWHDVGGNSAGHRTGGRVQVPVDSCLFRLGGNQVQISVNTGPVLIEAVEIDVQY